MKLKNLMLVGLVTGVLMNTTPSISNAEYLTAYEKIQYERYVVDTDSFFYPDKSDKYHAFNCIVWKYTSSEDKGSPFTFRFKYDDSSNTWRIAERNGKGDKLTWNKVEANSIASDVLRVTLPYLGHSTVDK